MPLDPDLSLSALLAPSEAHAVACIAMLGDTPWLPCETLPHRLGRLFMVAHGERQALRSTLPTAAIAMALDLYSHVTDSIQSDAGTALNSIGTCSSMLNAGKRKCSVASSVTEPMTIRHRVKMLFFRRTVP